MPDCTIFPKTDSGAFYPDITQGKKGITDSGYSHLNEHITIHREVHSKEMANFIDCVSACNENIYSRLNVFDILSDTFCGNWERYDKNKIYF